MARTLETLISESEIARRMPALAAEVAALLPAAARVEGALMIGPLKGAAMFMADLARALHREGVPVEFDFLRLASYGAGTESSGVVRLERELIHDPRGRHVLLVDDIIDTGRTLAFAQEHLRERGAASLVTCVFLDKPARRVVPVPVDVAGFVVPDVFVVGYGCDYAERLRELPFVGQFVDR